MTDLQSIQGFEELWRPPVAGRRVQPKTVVSGGGGGETRARLARIVRRAPEVMVKITGKTRDAGHLQAHLKYISREGSLPLEGPDGERMKGLVEVGELGRDWAGDDLKKREGASLSVSIMLSMPAGTDAAKVRDSARQFALETFGGKFDYAFALHTDVDHPHVHMAVRSLGGAGQRLNPRKADLERWRQTFARTLRDRGIEAEATPRRARGVVRKPEKTSVRKLRERLEVRKASGHERDSKAPRVLLSATLEALALIEGKTVPEMPWEAKIAHQQRNIRSRYIDAARELGRSPSPDDQALARDIIAFVKGMPAVATRRHELAATFRSLSSERDTQNGPGSGPSRSPSKSR